MADDAQFRMTLQMCIENEMHRIAAMQERAALDVAIHIAATAGEHGYSAPPFMLVVQTRGKPYDWFVRAL